MPKAPPAPKIKAHADWLNEAAPVLAVTVPEACRIVGIGKTTLYEEMSAGRIEGVKAGGRTLVTMESLRRYIASLPRISAGQAA